jgi:hypothetical protein
MSLNYKSVPINFPDPGAADTFFVYRNHETGGSGAQTLVAASFVNQAATSGGTTFTLTLHKYSNAGTPAVNGTISAALGGTTDYWADGVPKDFTLTAAQCVLQPGEWIACVYAEQSTGNPTRAMLNLEFVEGI